MSKLLRPVYRRRAPTVLRSGDNWMSITVTNRSDSSHGQRKTVVRPPKPPLLINMTSSSSTLLPDLVGNFRGWGPGAWCLRSMGRR